MISTRRTALLGAGAAVVLAAGLTACSGGGAAPAASPPTAASSAPSSSEPSAPSSSPSSPSSSEPSSAETSSAPAAAAAGSLTIPEPINGITEFPVPAGATTVDLGGVVNGSHQVGLSGTTTEELVAFYQEVLPAQGCALAADVSDGAVQYDLAFSGPLHGVVGDLLGQPCVTLYERPTSGINP